MTLAGMIALDRDALVCDMAETYGVFDIQALPVSTLAVLAVGLRDNSRIKMRLSGAKVPQTDFLLAAAVDRLSMLLWAKTEDGRNNTNRPPSLVKILSGEYRKEKQDKPMTFSSPVEFEEAWTRITGVRHGG